MSFHLLFTAFLGSLSTLETSLTSPAVTTCTAPALACPDTTIYPTDLNITFFAGDSSGWGCTGSNTTVTGIDYAVGKDIPIDGEGNMIYRSYQLSRDLQPGERVDWSRWGVMPDHDGRLLNWACGSYIDSLHAGDSQAYQDECILVPTSAGFYGPTYATCLRVLLAGSCQNEPEAGPNDGI